MAETTVLSEVWDCGWFLVGCKWDLNCGFAFLTCYLDGYGNMTCNASDGRAHKFKEHNNKFKEYSLLGGEWQELSTLLFKSSKVQNSILKGIQTGPKLALLVC